MTPKLQHQESALANSGWKRFWRKRIKSFAGAAGTVDHERECPRAPSLGCTLAIGHSHVFSLYEAQEARDHSGQQPGIHLHWILLQDKQFDPNLVVRGNRLILNPILQKRLDQEIASLSEDPPFLLASISGNEYQFIGFTEHPRRFDFSLPGRPDLPVRSGVEIIAPSLMRQTLERSMAHALGVMTALRDETHIPVVFLQPPPPVESEEYIREHHPDTFREAIQETGVAPAALRMKLWLLQSAIYKQKCDEIGCRYLGVPEEAINFSGFLRELAWRPDSVHANGWYGELILQRLEAMFREHQALGAAQ